MKQFHVACAIALGFTLLTSTPITLADPIQTKIANPVTGYYGNIACAHRVMADWTRIPTRSDAIKACNTAREQRDRGRPAPSHRAPRFR